MILHVFSLLAFAGLSVCPTPTANADGASSAGDLEALYRGGVPFSEFLAAADRRQEMWKAHYASGEPDDAAVARVAALPGTWRVLAIAEDWCSDSANTLPYLARLVERVDNVELRVIDSDAGRALMEAHPTPDGRAATPTFLVLDGSFHEVGCWVERPADLQAWALGVGADLPDRDFSRQKQAWYDEDGGQSTLREIVEVLEAAAAGRSACGT